jgi:hypothetical protein
LQDLKKKEPKKRAALPVTSGGRPPTVADGAFSKAAIPHGGKAQPYELPPAHTPHPMLSPVTGVTGQKSLQWFHLREPERVIHPDRAMARVCRHRLHRGLRNGLSVDKACVLAIASLVLLGNACVDITMPPAVAACAAKGKCGDLDASTGDSSLPYDSASSVPDDLDAIIADTPKPPAEVGHDGPRPESAREIGAEVPIEVGAEPSSGPEVGSEPEAGSEPEVGSEPDAESEPDVGSGPGPEPMRETGPEPGAEPAPEPRPEPEPEPGAEPPPDGGSVSTCPAGAGICDDFEDGNYTANPTWTVPGGFNVISDGSKVLAYTGSNNPAVATVGNAATALTIRAKVKATAFGGNSNSYRVGILARANSQGTPSSWYALTITGDGSLRLQTTDSTPSGCDAIGGISSVNTWYILTLTVGGTVGSTTLRGTLTDAAGGNAKTIGPCSISNGLPAGWAAVGIRGEGTHGEFDDVQITGITP